jgi:hypothetical protein
MDTRTRTCKECAEEKDLVTGFYKHHANTYFRTCRKCILKRSHVERKVVGYAALPQATQDIITNGLRDGKRCTKIATESGIKYTTLCHWVRTAQVHPVLMRQNAVDPLLAYELNRLRTI